MYSRLSRFLVITTVACLSLESESLFAFSSQIPGDELPKSLTGTCFSGRITPVHDSLSLKLASIRSSSGASDSCELFTITRVLGQLGAPSIKMASSLTFLGRQAYIAADVGVFRATLNMAGHNLSINGPSIGTIASSIILENTPLHIDATTLTLVGGQENWGGVSSVQIGNGALLFDITDSDSSFQSFGGAISVGPTLGGLPSEATIGLGSSIYTSSTLELTGQITDSGDTTQMLFASSPEGIDSSEATFWLTNPSNSWLGGTTVQGSNLVIRNSGALPTTGTVELNLGSSGFGSTLVFQLDSTDTYTGSGDITGDSWGAVFVESGTVNLSGDMSSVNLNLLGGTTILSGDNTLQKLVISSGAELQLSSSDNVYQNSTNYQWAVFEGGTLHVLPGGSVTFSTLASPTLQTTSEDPFFTVLSDSGAFANFYIMQVTRSSTLKLQGEGDIAIGRVVFLNTGIPMVLDIEGSFSGPIEVGSSSAYYNTCILNSVFSNADNIRLTGNTLLVVEPESSVGPCASGIFASTGSILQVEGSITSPFITIGQDGTLAGSGVVNGPVTVIGKLAPGSSPTLLTIVGDVHLEEGSTYSQYIEPGASAELDVSGSVVIGSGVLLQIMPKRGCYSKDGESYLILSADALNGTFDRITTGTILLKESLSYTSDSLTLTVVPVPLSTIATSGNAVEVGNNIDIVTGSGDTRFCSLIADFFLVNAEQINSALNQLQPSELKAFAIAQENNAVKVRDTLDIRFQRELDTVHCMKEEAKPCATKTNPFHIWMTGFGDNLHQSFVSYGRNVEVGYKENMEGVSLGGDYHFAEVLYAGVLGAYTNSNFKWQYAKGNGTIQSGYGGVYFSAIGKLFYGNASVMGAWSQYEAHRNIELPFSQFTAKNKHGGSQILSHVDTGVNLGWSGFTVRPFDSFDYISQTEDSFTERGASLFNLSVDKNNAILLRNELGLQLASCFCAKGSRWTISPKISWVREVRVKGAELTAEFAGTGTSFRAVGYFPSRSLVSPGVNVSGSLMQDLLVLDLYYNGELNGNYSDHSYGGQIRFGF